MKSKRWRQLIYDGCILLGYLGLVFTLFGLAIWFTGMNKH